MLNLTFVGKSQSTDTICLPIIQVKKILAAASEKKTLEKNAVEYKTVIQGYKSTIENLELKSDLFKRELLATRALLNKSNNQILYYKSELVLADFEIYKMDSELDKMDSELIVQKEQIKILLKKERRKENVIVALAATLIAGIGYITF